MSRSSPVTMSLLPSLLSLMSLICLPPPSMSSCPKLGAGGQERRAAGAPVVVRALLTHTQGDTAELWLQDVFKGAEKLKASLGVLKSHSLDGIKDRRINVTGWDSVCTTVEREKSQVILITPGKHHLSLVRGGASVFLHTDSLERKLFKLMGWRDWEDWSVCSATCGGGTQTRDRVCRKRNSCEGRHKEGRVCNTFSCKGATSALALTNSRYYKPSRRAFLPVAGRPGAWALRSSAYLLIPWQEAVGHPFPSQFTILMSFKPGPGAEGVLFSLTDPNSKQDYLSMNLGRGETGDLALQLVQSNINGTRVVPLPATIREGAWTQLSLSIQGETSVKTYLNCVWAGTQIIDGRSLAIPASPDLVIGYLVQTEIEQFTVTGDTGDVGEQCSSSSSSLKEEEEEVEEDEGGDYLVEEYSTDSREETDSSVERGKEKRRERKMVTLEEEGSGDGSGLGGDLLETDEAGSGSFELDWSSWSPCSSTCGPAFQSRWSRCADTGAMMECIQAGLETKVTRACRLPPCATNTTERSQVHITAQDIEQARAPTSLDQALAGARDLNGEHCQCHATGSGHCRLGSPVCHCNVGWSGPDCSTPLCRPYCKNGARCVSPDVCACSPGYTGARCQQAFCHPECQHGGQCESPFQCKCPPGTAGDHCELLVCSPPCGHGGVCIGPGTCSCPPGHSGPACMETTCVRDCHNGGVCLPGTDSCNCREGFYGLSCEKSSCLAYTRVKEPRRTGYRRMVSLGGAGGSLPVYKVYYRTVYRTVTKCKEDLT